MVPGRHLPQNGTKAEVTATEGRVCLKPPEEPLPETVPICEGNAIALDLISAQPIPAPVPATAEEPQKLQPESKSRPKCPQCGLQIPASRDLKGPQGSSLSVHSANSRRSKNKGGSVAMLSQPAATAAATPGDQCFDLLLSCLFCHCSAVVLGLLDLCTFGLSSVCSCCAEGCSCCCSAVQDAPVEELSCHTHCHSVLVQSCCEPIECLEFCLECCQICHRS